MCFDDYYNEVCLVHGAVLCCIFVFKSLTKDFSSVYSNSLNKVIWILLKIDQVFIQTSWHKMTNDYFWFVQTHQRGTVGFFVVRWKPCIFRISIFGQFLWLFWMNKLLIPNWTVWTSQHLHVDFGKYSWTF